MAPAKADDPKQGAIVWKGHAEALRKAEELLTGHGLPAGLLPLEEVKELGHVAETGYMWVCQGKKVEHEFKVAGKLVSYDTEITGFITQHKIKKLKGVKAKELMLWPPVGEISVDHDPPTGKIHFKSFAGITKTFPVAAFAAGQ